MGMPPDYMIPFMYSIETTVLTIWEEFPKLSDKDVEFTLEQLKKYFQQKSKKKEVEEPQSSFERRQILMDEILNAIDIREQLNADNQLIMNIDIQPNGRPIPSLGAFYVSAISRLIKSVRTWRKRDGYLKFIKKNVPH